MMRLKELRYQKNITQQKLAIDFNLSQNTISKWELGQANPDIATLIKLADYFNVTIDYLVGRSEQPIFMKNRTQVEERLLEKYRMLDRYDRPKVEGYIDALNGK